MSRIVEWDFEEFVCGDIRTQLINFSIDDHDFVMIFTHLSEFNDDDSIAELTEKSGKQIVVELAKQLTAAFDKGWSKSNLAQMVKFSTCFLDFEIAQTLSGQLSWNHFVQLIAIEKPVKREFYISLSQQERWSTRTMAQRIDAQLFERTLISKKPEDTVFLALKKLREDGLYNQELLLKDPYLLDFLELNDHYLERDLEDAILREIEPFLLELGAGFTFVEKREEGSGFKFYNQNTDRASRPVHQLTFQEPFRNILYLSAKC